MKQNYNGEGRENVFYLIQSQHLVIEKIFRNKEAENTFKIFFQWKAHNSLNEELKICFSIKLKSLQMKAITFFYE